MGLSFHAPIRAAETPEYVVVKATAENPQPDVLPTLRFVQHVTHSPRPWVVWASFPNVPDFQCEAWCYEDAYELIDARPILDGGRLELRHRVPDRPELLIVTVIKPEPGAVEVEARMALDTEHYPEAQMPERPYSLNLCFQLAHCPGFTCHPYPFPDFIKRCFIFTEKGRTFLLDTHRAKIPVRPSDDVCNTPPWVQSYVGVWQTIPEVHPDDPGGYSRDRYVTTVIGAVSRDGKYLAAIANDSAPAMHQYWHCCFHNNPKWLPLDAPTAERRWRVKIYAMENDPDALLARVGKDFPNAKHVRPVPSVPADPDAVGNPE